MRQVWIQKQRTWPAATVSNSSFCFASVMLSGVLKSQTHQTHTHTRRNPTNLQWGFTFLDWPGSLFICAGFIAARAKWRRPGWCPITATLLMSRRSAAGSHLEGQMVAGGAQSFVCPPLLFCSGRTQCASLNSRGQWYSFRLAECTGGSCASFLGGAIEFCFRCFVCEQRRRHFQQQLCGGFPQHSRIHTHH